MRILFVSQWFDPEPFYKGLSFVRALAARGHHVEVLTGFPNYPEGVLFPGYRLRPYQREVLDGIVVHRVFLYPSHDERALGRTANYATFAASAATVGVAMAGRADVAYVYHPPASVALSALALRGLRGTPFVLDIQDLWPDTLAATGMVRGRLVLRMVDLWCRLAYRAAARVTVLSPGFKAALVGRGVPEAKIDVIYNWCDEEALAANRQPACANDLCMEGRFNVTFAGNLGRAQDLPTLVRAAALLRERQPKVQFLVAGAGMEDGELRRAVTNGGLNNVRLLGRLAPAEVGWLLRASDALLVLLRDQPLFEITIPSKTQAYMFVGRPILMGVKGDAADLVRRAKAGISFAPGDAEALAHAIEELMAMTEGERALVGESGRRFYGDELSLDTGLKRVEGVLQAARRRG